MKRNSRALAACALLGVMAGLAAAQTPPQYPDYPSETPETFTPPTAAMDHTAREVMVPMRDGVKLRTVILIPAGAKRAGILLTRTPYDARSLAANSHSVHLGARLWGYDNPQTFVPNIFFAKPQDYRKATERIYRAPDKASFVELPVVAYP